MVRNEVGKGHSKRAAGVAINLLGDVLDVRRVVWGRGRLQPISQELLGMALSQPEPDAVDEEVVNIRRRGPAQGVTDHDGAAAVVHKEVNEVERLVRQDEHGLGKVLPLQCSVH